MKTYQKRISFISAGILCLYSLENPILGISSIQIANVLLILLICISIIKKKTYIKTKDIICVSPPFIFFLFYFLSYLLNYGKNPFPIVSWLAVFLSTSLYVLNTRANNVKIGYLVKYLVVYFFISVYAVVFILIYSNGGIPIGSEIRDVFDRSFELGLNRVANHLSYLYVISTVYVFKSKHKFKYTLLYIISVIPYFYVVVASGSRQSALVVLITIIYIVLLSRAKRSTKMAALAIFTMAGAVGVYFTWEFFVKRYIKVTTEQFREGSTRLNIYSTIIDLIKENPYTGSGIRTFREHTKYYAHSGYLAAISDIGIPAFMLSSSWSAGVGYFFWITGERNIGKSTLLVSLLICLSTMVFFNDLLRQQFIWITFAIASLRTKEKIN